MLLCSAVLPALAVTLPGSDCNRRKARYYYLEGARRMAQEKHADAYEYFKKAYSVDSSYQEAANAYGMSRLMIQTDSMQSEKELLRSLSMMRGFVDAYPADSYEGRFYAYVAARLDTLPEAIRIYERLDSLMPKETFTLIQLAEAYMGAKDSGKAVATLERYENIEGKSPQVSLKKMSYLLAAGDTVAAVAEANALVRSNPSEPAYQMLKGNLYEVIGDNDSTLACYLKAEDISPDNGSVKIALANFYKNIGDSVAFDNKMYEALLSEDFDPQQKTSLLEDYLKNLLNGRSDTGRGDHLFEVLIEQYPHEPEVLDLAARYSGAKGNYAEAAEQIGYAIDMDPSNVNYWGQLMRYQLADERAADAMATYRKAAEHMEMPDGLKLMYAAAATAAEDYKTAEETYADMIHETSPSLPLTDPIADTSVRSSLDYDGLARMSSLYNMLGDMYYAAGELDKTFRAYDNSLFFFPSNPMTLNNYAYFLIETGGAIDRALEMSRESLDMDPENPTYLDTYAWILFKKKEYKEALEYQMKAVEAAAGAGEQAAEFYHHLGDILFMNHQPDEALKNWEHALEMEPENELLRKKVEHKTFFYE